MEAISPTLPPEEKLDEIGGMKSSKAKDELLQNINRIDKELAKLEQKVGQLKKKQVIASCLYGSKCVAGSEVKLV